MIEPGLFRHYKNQKLYRVLFVAEWNTRELPDEDTDLRVYTERSHLCVEPKSTYLEVGSHIRLFDAKWSGNNAKAIYVGEAVVIYVALYDDGRVAARPLREFEDRVAVDGFRTTDVPRFERIGE